MPNMTALQVVPVAPIMMTSRPIIVGRATTVRIEAWGDIISVRSDGVEKYLSKLEHDEHDPFVMEFDCISMAAHMVHSKSWNFFDMLSDKLGWIKE
jgi:NAD kinase